MATKTKLSISISAGLAELLKELSEAENKSQSEVIESSLSKMVQERLYADAKATAAIDQEDHVDTEWHGVEPNFPEW